MTQTLPTDSQARKNIPLARGCLDYFPAALAAVAELSLAGNNKHNPGEELHHARGKSSDHADTILRHLLDRGTVDPDDGILHSTKVAWRALALLQEELEAGGSPLARGARLPERAAVVPHPDCGICLDSGAQAECLLCHYLRTGEVLDERKAEPAKYREGVILRRKLTGERRTLTNDASLRGRFNLRTLDGTLLLWNASPVTLDRDYTVEA